MRKFVTLLLAVMPSTALAQPNLPPPPARVVTADQTKFAQCAVSTASQLAGISLEPAAVLVDVAIYRCQKTLGRLAQLDPREEARLAALDQIITLRTK